MSALSSLGCRCGAPVRSSLLLSAAPSVLRFCRRSFSKRLGSSGFAGSGERRGQTATRKQTGSGDATPSGGADSSSGPAGAAAGGQQRAGGGSGDSMAALEAENEERLTPFMLPIITARPPADSRSSEQRVAEWQYEAAVRRRLRANFIRDNLQLAGKLRRRWEAINGLTEELRHVCLREDRTPLPASLRIPLRANGQLLLPNTPGLAGAEPWTERELKQHIDWQQRQKERGLPY